MLTVNIVCIGKLKEDYLRRASAEYQKRLCAFCRLNIIELDEYKLPQNPSDAQILSCIEQEGKAILAKAGGVLIPLCIEGKELSSEELAGKIGSLCVDGISEISFIIGGSHGLSAAIKRQGKLSLSMSRMTFPHQLARVMLLEQIYRAFMISSGGKYHK